MHFLWIQICKSSQILTITLTNNPAKMSFRLIEMSFTIFKMSLATFKMSFGVFFQNEFQPKRTKKKPGLSLISNVLQGSSSTSSAKY